jgi:hypothetical protein
MTYDEALEDDEPLALPVAKMHLRQHGCRVLEVRGVAEPEGRTEPANWPAEIRVSNDLDEADWIACTPAAILGWLGY